MLIRVGVCLVDLTPDGLVPIKLDHFQSGVELVARRCVPESEETLRRGKLFLFSPWGVLEHEIWSRHELPTSVKGGVEILKYTVPWPL